MRLEGLAEICIFPGPYTHAMIPGGEGVGLFGTLQLFRGLGAIFLFSTISPLADFLSFSDFLNVLYLQ